MKVVLMTLSAAAASGASFAGLQAFSVPSQSNVTGLANQQEGPAYTLQASWTISSPNTTTRANLCSRGLSFDSDGHIHVAHQNGVATGHGRAAGECTSKVSMTAFDDKLNQALQQRVLQMPAPMTAMSLDPGSGRLFAAGGDGQLYMFDLTAVSTPIGNWVPLRRQGQPGLVASLRALAVGPNDIVFGAADAGISRFESPDRRWAPWAAAIGGTSEVLPRSITVDSSSRVYVLGDSSPFRIYRYSSTGTLDSAWRHDETTSALGVLASYPNSAELLAFETDSTGAGLVRRLDSMGRTVRLTPTTGRFITGRPPLLAVGPAGQYALAGLMEGGQETLQLYAADGSLVAERALVSISGAAPVAGPGGWAKLAAAGDGVVTVGLAEPGATTIYSSQGEVRRMWPSQPDFLDLTIDEVGQTTALHATRPNVVRRDGSGAILWTADLPSTPTGMGVAADSRFVYVADSATGMVRVLDTTTGAGLGALGEVPRRTAGPHDLDVSGGWLATLDSFFGVVEVWDMTGSAAGPVAKLAIPEASSANAIAVGTDRFALAGNGVKVYDFTGRSLAAVEPLGAFPGVAIDVAFDDTGRLAVLSVGNLPGYQVISVFGPGTDAVPPVVPTPPDVPTPEPANLGDCRAGGDKWAAPGEIVLGEEVTVTLTLAGACPASPPSPADIVLVLDVSGSMQGDPAQALGEAVHAFVDGIDLEQHRVGVVGFSDRVELMQSLTSSRDTLNRLPRYFGSAGGTDIAAGLALADDHLRQSVRPDVREVVVLMSDGGSAAEPALTESRAMLLRGVEIYTVAFGSANVVLLRQIAVYPDRFFSALTADELIAIYETIAAEMSGAGTAVVLDDYLGPDMEFVRDSASIALWGPPTRLLRWRVGNLPAEPLTITYRVRPDKVGWLPTNDQAFYDFNDSDSTRRRYTYPVPYVRVVAPTPEATATPPPTPTPVPGTIYLPVAHAGYCYPAEQAADVVLVIDVSSSMDGAPIAAAIAAAREFVALLDLSRDRAGIVAYDATARVAAPIGDNRAALNAALDGLRVGYGTRIDYALAAAGSVLAARDPSGNGLPVVVLLSDGRHAGPPQEVLAQAAPLHATGAVIYTVALGADADLPLLAQVAGAPERALVAPSPGDLAGVYGAVAGRLVCR